MGEIIKRNRVIYHESADHEEPQFYYGDSVIKRNNINYSIPQKVRFGMLPPSAMDEYYRQKEDETKEEMAVEEVSEAPKEEKKDRRFWEDDEGDREQLSQEDYEKFLSENAISLNNPEDIIASLTNN